MSAHSQPAVHLRLIEEICISEKCPFFHLISIFKCQMSSFDWSKVQTLPRISILIVLPPTPQVRRWPTELQCSGYQLPLETEWGLREAYITKRQYAVVYLTNLQHGCEPGLRKLQSRPIGNVLFWTLSYANLDEMRHLVAFGCIRCPIKCHKRSTCVRGAVPLCV